MIAYHTIFLSKAFILFPPIHDIGNEAIADNILLKPGKLDESEFSIMKQHAVMVVIF